ncbi:hypothetical protein [Nocardia australiensis]|uniref:hypothetical protein n=1 Tax=Nocardia australiensis TaxID=2887191 RepID=UPI001D14CB23|nr:hypothetical protein [Nocardia australiensis]
MTNPYPPTQFGPLPKPALPEDVRTARQLWWGVVGFGVLQLGGSMLAAVGQRHDFAKQMFDQVKAEDPGFTMATADLMVQLAFVVAILLGLVVAALGLVIAHQLVRGKLWARTLLTVVAVWLVLIAIGTMFTLGSISGAGSLVAGAAAIVQGVLAAGATYLSHRPDSTAYFQMNRR